MNSLLFCRKFFFTIFLLSLSTWCLAQNTSISGTVKTSDGTPAESVSVSLQGTGRATITDRNGNYEIKNVKPGTYTLSATFVGLEKQTQNVTITAGNPIVLNFILKESAAKLNEVVISSRNANKLNTIVAKMPLKYLENPQVYTTVSSELLKQQGVVNFDDAMRNVPGLSRTWESTGRAGDGAAYFALRGFEAQPSLYNGLPGFTNGGLDPANIEEIQVIKGPSGTLFGGSFYAYGGIINVITKKPYFTTGGEVTYNTGSFGMNRVSADFNTPLSKTEKIALRINTAYQTENSFQDAGYKKSFFFAPSLTYQVTDRLRFDVLAEFLQEERAVPPVFFHTNRADPLTFKNIAELNLNNFKSFTSNDLPMKNPRFNLQAQMTYKLSDTWTSQTILSKGSAQSNGYYGYIYGNAAGSNVFDQYIHKDNHISNTLDIQQNFNGDFKLGNMRNRVLVGLDYFNNNVIDNGTGYSLMRQVTPQGGIIEIDPAHPIAATQSAVDALLAGTGASTSNSSNTVFAAYASDVLNITPVLSVMASLRADYFVNKGEYGLKDDDYNQLALSPKFGMTYQVVPEKVSLFGNYMNAFVNVSPRQVTNADGSNPRIKSFKPEHADQLEFGVKTNLINNRLSATVSYYDIKLSNRVTQIVGNLNDYDQRGKVRSRGFELELNANPAQGLNIIAGYSHNNIKNTAGIGTDFYAEAGRAPGGQGPQDMANLWATYKFHRGSLKDFGFGIGGNYAGIYKVVDNSAVGVFNLPSYTLLNASLFYNTEHLRITLNGNNLTDKRYYIGYWSVNPQRPVNYTASIAFKF